METQDIKIEKNLFKKIRAKKARLDKKRPFPKDSLQKLKEEIRLQHTNHSNAIEGNTLTLFETKLILEDGITIGGKSLKEHLEALNNANAFDLIEELAKNNKEISHENIQKIHEIVIQGILKDAGKYRTQNVRIVGSQKTPPDFLKIPGLIDDLIKNVNKNSLNPIIIASFLHHKFAEIHPFTDGNGRVARLLCNLYLIKKGYPIIVVRKENRAKYYKFLNLADKGNLSPFANFIAKAIDESLMHYMAIFGGKDELIPLKELTEISRYSQQYLSLRARQGKLDAVKIGRVWYSSKSALGEYCTID